MAKYSMKVKGKEIGPAEVYAPPHTMEGKDTNAQTYSNYETGAEVMTKMNFSGRKGYRFSLCKSLILAFTPLDFRRNRISNDFCKSTKVSFAYFGQLFPSALLKNLFGLFFDPRPGSFGQFQPGVHR